MARQRQQKKKRYAPWKNLALRQTKQVQWTKPGEEEIEDRLRLERGARRAHAQAECGGGNEDGVWALELEIFGKVEAELHWKDFDCSFDPWPTYLDLQLLQPST